MLEAICVAWLLLFLGDFLSTFFYHIPEHIFGTLHVTTHHSWKKNFRHYAILTFNPLVLLDGILGALPYLIVAVVLWPFSPIGVIGGLLFGQFHVWWRHITSLGAKTPKLVTILCKVIFITTPERHWIHHQKTNQAYGDIFTFFEEPAKVWLRWLRLLRLYLKQSPLVNKYSQGLGARN
ncbi:sterol desaturase family protein [Planktothrix sp. FACHB-1355]|uniref:Sterol desaturase family protein n=1 Tax=Aerosakkonema funiforme FACHB-1375 TaxID=2949571 RepID=A0A926VLR0_9CYAN|nr:MULTISPECIES: sterol desaturase family protein [Oscillatoriales]MBD2186250.1 sterol desaturase family protein [Aerosakkonema funiforme FACHB-1375]MBD3563061.1 sterol desaturase family protein [Planktothrix sp. FACHB-1355]